MVRLVRLDSEFDSKIAELSQKAGKAEEDGEIYKNEGMVYSHCGLRADRAYRTEGHGLAMRAPGFRRRRSDGWRSYGWNCLCWTMIKQFMM